MITENKACEWVEQLLGKIESGDKYLVDKENIREHDQAWVVYYNTEKYLKTNDSTFALLGNGRFLADNQTGKIEATSSSDEIPPYIDEYSNDGIV